MEAKEVDMAKTESEKYFRKAAEIAKKATCKRARCGSVIVASDQIIGKGYNSPPLDNEANRTCQNEYSSKEKSKYDKTCCIHAEWRAIIDALKQNPNKLKGSTLYFMRINESGDFTDAGKPFCTVCSRLALETGIRYFVLWDKGGAIIRDTREYNRLSYDFYKPQHLV